MGCLLLGHGKQEWWEQLEQRVEWRRSPPKRRPCRCLRKERREIWEQGACGECDSRGHDGVGLGRANRGFDFRFSPSRPHVRLTIFSNTEGLKSRRR